MPYGNKEGGRLSYKNIVPAPPKPTETNTLPIVQPVFAMGEAANTRSPKRKRDEDIEGSEFIDRIGMFPCFRELRLTRYRFKARI